MIRRGSAEQCGLAVGDLDGEIDAAIDQRAKAFEGGEEGLDPGQLCRPNIAGATAHVVGVTELPVGAGLRDRVLVLLAERTGTHGPELSELGLGPSELGLPLRERFIFHAGELPSEPAWKSSRRVRWRKVFSRGSHLVIDV